MRHAEHALTFSPLIPHRLQVGGRRKGACVCVCVYVYVCVCVCVDECEKEQRLVEGYHNIGHSPARTFKTLSRTHIKLLGASDTHYASTKGSRVERLPNTHQSTKTM